MSIFSGRFACFFALIFGLYWLLPWHRLRLPLPGRRSPSRRAPVLTGDEMRVWLLLAASFWFFAAWNLWPTLLVSLSFVGNYLLVRGMEATTRPRLRRLLLGINLTANLGFLAYFKYFNFFVQSLGEVLQTAGVRDSSLHYFLIFAPVGISYYALVAIGYAVDVYRRRIPAERNLAHFLLLLLFFPHLVAGPLARGRDLLPQMRRRKRWSWPRFQTGVEYCLLGLLKWVLVERLSAFVDPVFYDPRDYGTAATWVALIAYALQLYADFSGYADVAVGTAYLLGYKLARNFNLPYLTVNLADYWRRWNISLMSWLRDYVFLPLGGARRGRWKTARNLLITLALCGLWHGAIWTAIAFGVLHGILLIGHRSFHAFCRTRPASTRWLVGVPGTVLRVALTFLTVCLVDVLLRAPTFATALAVWARLLWPQGGRGAPLPLHGFGWIVGVIVLAHVAGRLRIWEKWCIRRPVVVGAGYALALAASLVLAPHERISISYTFF